MQIRTRERLFLGDWYHVAMTYDGSGKAAGLRLFVNGVQVDAEVVRDALTRTDSRPTRRCGWGARRSASRSSDRSTTCVSTTARSPRSRSSSSRFTTPSASILSGVTGKRSRDEAGRVKEYFLTYAAPEALRTMNLELKALRKQKADLDKVIPTAMVMAEMKKPRDSFVLARGDYRNQTEKVTPGVPSMLPPLPEGAPLNRLTLAKWLVQPDHPLTVARRGEPLLADVFRPRHRQDAGGLRGPGRAAGASRAARLAGDRVRPHGLGRSSDAAADRDVGDLPPVGEDDASAAREGSREPAAGARPARPPAGGDDPRHRAGRERPAQRRDRRTERASVSAQRAVGRDGLRRRLLGAGVRAEPREGSVPARHVHLLEAHGSAGVARDVRRARTARSAPRAGR